MSTGGTLSPGHLSMQSAGAEPGQVWHEAGGNAIGAQGRIDYNADHHGQVHQLAAVSDIAEGRQILRKPILIHLERVRVKTILYVENGCV